MGMLIANSGVMTPRQLIIRPAADCRGFTLLEIMLVVALIGISLTLLTLSFDRDTGKVAKQEARRFAALIEHVREESVVTGRSVAVEVDESAQQYQFLQPGESWEPIKGDDVLRPRQLPEFLNVTLELLESRQGNGPLLVIVDAMGEITPFELTIRADSGAYTVALDPGQNVLVTRVDDDAG